MSTPYRKHALKDRQCGFLRDYESSADLVVDVVEEALIVGIRV